MSKLSSPFFYFATSIKLIVLLYKFQKAFLLLGKHCKNSSQFKSTNMKTVEAIEENNHNPIIYPNIREFLQPNFFPLLMKRGKFTFQN